MKVDIIILSKGDTPEKRKMTQETIDTCHASEEDIQFDILVYEGHWGTTYKDCKTLHYTEEFHYNRLMNKGISDTNNPYVCLCNNDLIFMKGWASKIIKVMEEGNYLSASPNHTPYAKEAIREGYRIGVCGEVKGWCIFTDRKLYEKIGKIDESVSFWYSDNVYADQLEAQGIKHVLVRNSFVKHLESVTLNEAPDEIKKKLTEDQGEIYAKVDKRFAKKPTISKRRDNI